MNLAVRILLRTVVVSVAAGTLRGQETAPPQQAAAGQEPAGATQADEPAPPVWTPEERAAIELLRSLRSKERPGDEELAARLAPAGERIFGLLFELLAQRSVPALDGGRVQTLSEVQERVVLLAVAQLDREPVLIYIDQRLLVDPTPGLRRAALGCIGAIGRANDLPQLFDLAFPSEELELDRRMEAALEHAVTALLPRDPRAYEQLVALRRITRPELLPALIRAVGAAGDPRGLAYFSEIAYWHEALAMNVMGQVPLLGPSGDEEIDNAMRVRLRRYLGDDDPGRCRAAIMAVTALADRDSIAQLIELLASHDTGLRGNAHWALKQLTGLALSATQESWARWHQAELSWLVRSKPREFQRLRDGDAAVAADALRAILQHPLARGELVAAVPDLLRHRFPAIRILACRTLADLAATDAVEKLVWALEDPTPEVSQAAHAALRSLTRLDLPRDPIAWQSATNSEPRGTEL